MTCSISYCSCYFVSSLWFQMINNFLIVLCALQCIQHNFLVFHSIHESHFLFHFILQTILFAKATNDFVCKSKEWKEKINCTTYIQHTPNTYAIYNKFHESKMLAIFSKWFNADDKNIKIICNNQNARIAKHKHIILPCSKRAQTHQKA